MVFQATIQLQSIMKRKHFEKWEGLKQASILGNIQLDELMEEENSDSWKQVVSWCHIDCNGIYTNTSRTFFFAILGISTEPVSAATDSLT